MDAAHRRRLTDVVTLARVPIAVAMVVARRPRRGVLALFLLGATTDVVDGPLARRLGTASDRGARLDSAADAVFVAASAVTVAPTVPRDARRLLAGGVALVGGTRLAALLLTRRRFGAWSVAHTHLNKATGLGLAGATAVALARGRMPVAVLGAVAVLAEVAAIEELVLAAREAELDRDRASLLGRARAVRFEDAPG